MNGSPDWLRPEPRDANVFVWHFVPQPIEGFERLRLQRYAAAPLTTTESIHGQGEALVHLMTFECESRAAARQQLLNVLDGFQGPPPERSDVAGEVSFVAGDGIGVVAVRGNLVLQALNGGPKLVSVVPVVRGIDERLLRQPQNFAERLRVTPHLTVRRAVAAPLDLPAEDVFVHVIAEGGEVHLVDGRPVYTATATGRHRLSVVAGAAGAQIDVDVE